MENTNVISQAESDSSTNGEASDSSESDWLDRENAVMLVAELTSPMIITEVHEGYFFGEYMYGEKQLLYKIHGDLENKYCVDDLVIVTYSNGYRTVSDSLIKTEGDMVRIAVETVAEKPVIYLYPEVKTDVNISLDLNGEITCTYPKYNDGWLVTAQPDGTLTDQKGQTYSYLYWEGTSNVKWDMSKGFCIKGDDTADFLEYALEKLGLNRKEANEFIVYWLPLMEQNEYNVISFQTAAYTDNAVLNVTPNPDTVIRVFMTWKASDIYVEMEPQTLFAPERQGFTLVEWGGCAVK